MKYTPLFLAAGITLIAATPTPAPSPPPLATSPLPASTPSPAASPAATASADANANTSLDSLFGSPKPASSAAPKGTPTPPADNRIGLDGVWEVQIQRGGTDVEYTHFTIVQKGTTLNGMYLTQDKKKYPLLGSLDGNSVRLVISLPDGSTMLLEARVDGTTDMLGMLTDAKERIPFTAAYRPKEKWFDNVNSVPGGLGGQGGYLPPRS